MTASAPDLAAAARKRRLVAKVGHRAEADVVSGGELVPDEVLEDDGDPTLPRARLDLAQVDAVDHDPARRSVRSSPTSSLMSVVFPAPFWPTSARERPAWIDRSSASRTS